MYRKFKNLKISYIIKKPLFLSIICSRSDNKNGKLFKDEESIKKSNILGLTKY